MSPTGLSLGELHALQSPLLFYPVSLSAPPHHQSGAFRCLPCAMRNLTYILYLLLTLPSTFPVLRPVQGQLVLAGVLVDETLLGSLRDGQLGGALGAIRVLHDLLAQLGVA